MITSLKNDFNKNFNYLTEKVMKTFELFCIYRGIYVLTPYTLAYIFT